MGSKVCTIAWKHEDDEKDKQYIQALQKLGKQYHISLHTKFHNLFTYYGQEFVHVGVLKEGLSLLGTDTKQLEIIHKLFCRECKQTLLKLKANKVKCNIESLCM